MSPSRRNTIRGPDNITHEVREYWWAGKYVTYVDNQATEETFEEACARLEDDGEEP